MSLNGCYDGDNNVGNNLKCTCMIIRNLLMFFPRATMFLCLIMSTGHPFVVILLWYDYEGDVRLLNHADGFDIAYRYEWQLV
jgi:hypothetical protein